jgi:hypothetical protein
VAAVLGVIITMGSIGGAAEEIGKKVAAALVGTFLGIYLAYGFVSPLAVAVETRDPRRARLHGHHPHGAALLRARRRADDLRRVRAAQHRAARAALVRRARGDDPAEGRLAMPPKEKSKIIIKKVKKGGHGGHHGGSWKVAYADFVTAMMAFFMVMWILGMDESTKKAMEGYFSNPVGFKKGYSAGASPIGAGGSPTRT